MKKSNLVIWIIAVCALFAAAYTVYSKYSPGYIVKQPQQQAGENSGQAGGKQETKKVPIPDFTLKDLDGNEVSLSDFKGKPVVLNFWTTWCSVCREEMPELNELNKEFEKSGEAVLLTVDVQESEKTVRDYLSSNGYSMRVLMDSKGELAQLFGIEGFPTTFIIDGEGNAVAYIPGATDKKTLEELLEKYTKS